MRRTMTGSSADCWTDMGRKRVPRAGTLFFIAIFIAIFIAKIAPKKAIFLNKQTNFQITF